MKCLLRTVGGRNLCLMICIVWSRSRMRRWGERCSNVIWRRRISFRWNTHSNRISYNAIIVLLCLIREGSSRGISNGQMKSRRRALRGWRRSSPLSRIHAHSNPESIGHQVYLSIISKFLMRNALWSILRGSMLHRENVRSRIRSLKQDAR